MSGQDPTQNPARASTIEGDAALNAVAHNSLVVKLSVPSIRQRECTVCYDVLPVGDFPRLAGCIRYPTVCKVCFQKWLSGKVGSTALLSDIKCPCYAPTCKTPFSYEDVRRYADQETFDRYDRHAFQEAVRDDPDFRYCTAPFCPSGQIHDTEAGNIFICQLCNRRHCTTHGVPFHVGESCENYDRRMRFALHTIEERYSLDEVAKSSKPCPGAKCGYRIHKFDGCDFTRCTQCRFEFCFECFAPYGGAEGILEKGNTAHARHCPYHTDNLKETMMRKPKTVPIKRSATKITSRKCSFESESTLEAPGLGAPVPVKKKKMAPTKKTKASAIKTNKTIGEQANEAAVHHHGVEGDTRTPTQLIADIASLDTAIGGINAVCTQLTAQLSQLLLAQESS